MTTSETINELAAALAKAQIEMTGAKKDSTNPHFKSAYADLASVRDAAKPLASHGIAVIQSCRMATTEAGQMVAEVETRLVHASGQWMADTLAVPVSKPDAQGIGSAITYGRRYSLAAFAGIAPADDDGEAAVGRSAGPMPVVTPKEPQGFQDWLDDLRASSTDGKEALRQAWKDSPAQMKNYYMATNPKWADTLKGWTS